MIITLLYLVVLLLVTCYINGDNPSAIVKPAFRYSKTWNSVNTTASTRVIPLLRVASFRRPPSSAECDHVSAAPDESRSPVLRRGIIHGSLGSIPFGGHTAPSEGAGFRLEWKYAQKKAKKSLISDTINRIIPRRSPVCTAVVCWPSNVASRITSRHQKVTLIRIDRIPKRNTDSPRVNPCLYRTRPNTINSAEKAVYSGHGLGSTIW